MDIVLGVSITPMNVQMVLIEGEKADGVTIENDVLETSAAKGAATASASEQVGSAVLDARETSLARGHHLVATGVTWNESVCAGAVLRESLAARGIEDVSFVSELHAAGALAREVGAALAHDTTALLLITRDTATLSVVRTADGSIGKLLSRSLIGSNELAELTLMVGDLDGPQCLFVVGSGVNIGAAKAHLENHVRLPVSAPEDPDFALARGAALAAAAVTRAEHSTEAIAYSKDPDAESLIHEFASATGPLSTADVATQSAPVSDPETVDVSDDGSAESRRRRRRLFPVGSSVAAMVVVVVVVGVMTVAANVRPTAVQQPGPSEQAAPPAISASAPITEEAAAVPSLPLVQSPPVAAQPVPVQAPPVVVSKPVVRPPAPRTVVVAAPPVKKRTEAVAPVARPAAVPDVPAVAVAEPPAAVPAPVPIPQLANPVLTPPASPLPAAPRFVPPQITFAPFLAAPAQDPSSLSPMYPPSRPQQNTPQWPIVSRLPQILGWPRQRPPQVLAPQTQPAQEQASQYPLLPEALPQAPPLPQRQRLQAQNPGATQETQDPRWPHTSLPNPPVWMPQP